jgi:hypothetical protein
MPLYDNPPHRADVYSTANPNEAGAGTQPVYTLVQSAVPCIERPLSAMEQARFAALQIELTHCVCFKASTLTSPLQRGWKLVVNGASLHISQIKVSQAMGTIPSLVEVMCEDLL